MHVRWFGEPWGKGGRAPVCEDDRYRVPIEEVAGRKCLHCSGLITESDRGVITACSTGIWGYFWLDSRGVEDPETGEIEKAGEYSVCAYHLTCWLEEVVGGEMSATIINRMDAGERREVQEGLPELIELAEGYEEAEAGKGWRS